MSVKLEYITLPPATVSTTPSKVFPFIYKGTTKEYLVVETPLDLASTSLTCGIVGSSEPSVTQPFSGNGVTGSNDPTGPDVEPVKEFGIQTSIIYLIQIDYNLFKQTYFTISDCPQPDDDLFNGFS